MHIALLTLKETIEGEMNGETVEIGIISVRSILHPSLIRMTQESLERLQMIYSGMKVLKVQSDLGFEN